LAAGTQLLSLFTLFFCTGVNVERSSTIKNFLNIFYRCLGPCILLYIFWMIGLDQIIDTLLSLSLGAIAIVFSLKIFATACRLAKYVIFNNQFSVLKNSEIYLSAKMGGEISIIGHFAPLLNDEFRNAKTVQLLLIDRYLEIYSTFLVAFVCSLLFVSENIFYWLSSFSFAMGLIAASLPYFFCVQWTSRFRLINRMLDMSRKLNFYLRQNGRLLLVLLVLSIFSSLLEFMVVKVIFHYMAVAVDFPIIPIVWAIGGVVGYLTFLSLGTAEITSLVLFEKLAKISDYSIASMIIVAKVFIAISSLFVYLWIVLLKFSSRFFNSERLFGASTLDASASFGKSQS
jgi:hypothetical protein